MILGSSALTCGFAVSGGHADLVKTIVIMVRGPEPPGPRGQITTRQDQQ
jgi:hypothetical protein